MLDGALNHTEWGDRAIALGPRDFPQADPQSRARDLQGTSGHGKPLSDLVPADSSSYPLFNFLDVFGREFSYPSVQGITRLLRSATTCVLSNSLCPASFRERFDNRDP